MPNRKNVPVITKVFANSALSVEIPRGLVCALRVDKESLPPQHLASKDTRIINYIPESSP